VNVFFYFKGAEKGSGNNGNGKSKRKLPVGGYACLMQTMMGNTETSNPKKSKEMQGQF
jgi:hypothetical protein